MYCEYTIFKSTLSENFITLSNNKLDKYFFSAERSDIIELFLWSNLRQHSDKLMKDTRASIKK